MRLSLRQRIFWWSLGSAALIPAAAFFFIDDTFQSTILRGEEQSLIAGYRLLAELQNAEFADGLDETARMAVTPTLRAAMETGDSVTVQQNLDLAIRDTQLDWMVAATPEGRLLAWTEGAPVERVAQADILFRETRFYDTGDLWYLEGKLVQVHASGMFIGQAQIGVLVTGATIGADRVERLESGTEQAVAFLASDDVVAGARRLTDENRKELARLWADREVGQEMTGSSGAGNEAAQSTEIRRFEIGDDPYMGIALPLPSSSGDLVGRLIAYQPLAEAMRPARDLRLALLSIAMAGIVLAFISSYLLSRGVVKPVNRLMADTVRLGSGDLDTPILPERDDEIGKLAEGFERMRESLGEARKDLLRAERLSAVGRAASAIVHDFRQPVMTVKGHLSLLKEDWDDEEQRAEDFATIDEELGRMNEMMSEILEFARGGEDLRPTPGAVEDLLNDSARAVRITFEAEQVALSVEHGYGGQAVLDFPRTRRIVENLLRNAAAAVPAGGHVGLRSVPSGSGFRIVVEDDGPGIPSEVRETLFEPFVTHGKKGGTGLGLAIVKQFTERQGGTVVLETSARGTAFILDFPFAQN
jgi:signal transduction histidine kinase